MGSELRSVFAGHFGYACAECARVGDIDIVGDDVRALGQEVDEDAVLRVLDVVVVADALAVLDVAVGELIARELVGWLEACRAMSLTRDVCRAMSLLMAKSGWRLSAKSENFWKESPKELSAFSVLAEF